jgi:hypothetical protein
MSQKYKTFIILVVICTFVAFGVLLLKRPQPKTKQFIGVKDENTFVGEQLTPNPFATPTPPQPEFWLRIWNKDGTPAQGFPQPEQVFATSKFKPVVTTFVDKSETGTVVYRIEFKGEGPTEPKTKRGKRK